MGADARAAAHPPPPAPWSWVDALVAAGLVAVAALSRWPFRSAVLWSWDAGLFALALDDYDVVAHRPQPPGYLFYVATAKLLRTVGGLGANEAYVLLSLAAASLTVAALYLLGVLLFDRPAGLLAAGRALTSPAFWFYSAITYPYTTLALGSAALGLLGWLLLHGRLARPWLVGPALGLAGGFRQDLLLFLGPLVAACFAAGVGLRGRDAQRQLGLAALGGLAAVAAWWAATDLASGGWGALWRALALQATNVERGTSAFATGAAGLRANARQLLGYSKETFYLAVFPALAYFLQWPTQPRREGRRPPFLLLWLAPPLLFYLLVHIGDTGYVFSLLPPVLLAAGAGLARAAAAIAENLPGRWAARRARHLRHALAVGLVALILPYHAWLFLGGDRDVSAGHLDCRGRALEDALATIAADFPPATTQLATAGYLPHVVYYLPAYRHVQALSPGHDRTWRAPAGVERVLVFDLELRVAHGGAWSRVPLACPAYALAVAEAAGTTFTFDAAHYALGATP